MRRVNRRLFDNQIVISVARNNALLRAAALGSFVLLAEWGRTLVSRLPYMAVPALIVGGIVLGAAAVGWPLDKLGIGGSRLGLRVLGGLALGAVLLLPAAVRSTAVPLLPASLAVAAVAVSIGEEIAFRGALYAALEQLGGAPLAVIGSTVVWTAAHALSHPPSFLWAVAAAGLVLALWRWACRDLVAPIIGHVIADVAL